MQKSQQLVQRGFKRIILAFTPLWLLYWCIWIPGTMMDASTRYHLIIGQPLDNRTWLEKWWEITSAEPWSFLFGAILVPIIIYLIVMGLIAIYFWIKQGFKGE